MESLLSAGVPEWSAEGLVELAEHVYGPGYAAETVDTVERVTGRPARRWADFLADGAGSLARASAPA